MRSINTVCGESAQLRIVKVAETVTHIDKSRASKGESWTGHLM
jgi:hypothetical protein